jgi:hypothetical protein
MQEKSRARLQRTKSVKQSDSMPYAHFTEHLVGVNENPPQEYDENPETRAFDPTAQEQGQLLLARHHTQSGNSKSMNRRPSQSLATLEVRALNSKQTGSSTSCIARTEARHLLTWDTKGGNKNETWRLPRNTVARFRHRNEAFERQTKSKDYRTQKRIGPRVASITNT